MNSMGISKYRTIKSIIEKVDDDKKEELRKIQKQVEKGLAGAEDRHRKASAGSKSISEAASSTMKMPELSSLEDMETRRNLVAHALGGSENFIQVYANLAGGMKMAWTILNEIVTAIEVDELLQPEDRAETSRERMHDLSAEYQLNQHSCEAFVGACMKLANYRWQLTDMTQQIAGVVEKYHNALTERHSTEGIKVYHAPVLTDFAMAIYDNIAHHGEMTELSSEGAEISSYSMRKAEAIIEWIKDDDFRDILLSETSAFTTYFKRELWDLWKTGKRLEKLFNEEIERVTSVYFRRFRPISGEAMDRPMSNLEEVDPNRVKFRDRSAGMTEDERHDLHYKNEVIAQICRMLKDDTPSYKIASEVWEAVKKLKRHYLEVNSFYVCRIAQGNPMSGKGNGQLEVIPGKKPTAKFEDIVGSGFDDVRKFVKHIEHNRKWAPLYLITSPRRKTDKSNILLIGPMGCGKTECMRAICNEEDCIAIFAQGSDFLTSWMGEAQKNPKRLFEAAVKLQKESDLHVHILIDEIDEVLNTERSTTTINLSLEFQMIMDGIVEYPNISVWGATNNPERIPMPMIRRFSQVLIVGKLDQGQRVQLLKHFLSTLPLSDRFTDQKWESYAKRLEGATGDVVRKVCEHAWRTEISRFIEENPDDADRMLSILGKLSYEPKTGVKPDQLEPRKADEEVDERHYGGKKTSRREKFLREFRRVFELEPEVVSDAIDVALENVGIINEIDTAVRTYDDAEKMLAVLKNERMKGGKKDGDEEPAEADG